MIWSAYLASWGAVADKGGSRGVLRSRSRSLRDVVVVVVVVVAVAVVVDAQPEASPNTLSLESAVGV